MEDDVKVAADVNFRHYPNIGKHIAIDHGVYCTTYLILGDYIHIGPYCTIIGGSEMLCTMEDFTTLAAGCRLICASMEHLGFGIPVPFLADEYKDTLIKGNITIKRFANVLTNAVILPGVTLGEGSVISVGSVVTGDTEPWMIYAGTPARPIKAREKEKMLAKASELGYVY